MAIYTITATPSGSQKTNAASRNINSVFPYDPTKYCTITSITRRNGVYCKTGSTSGTATFYAKMQILIGTTVYMESELAKGSSDGSGPTSANYMTTSITNFSAEQSMAIVAAWAAGTLQIKWVLSGGTSSYKPYFRSGYYNDTITITGEDVNFRPWISSASMYRADSTGAVKDNDVYVGFSCTVGVGEVGDSGSGTLTIYKDGSQFYQQTGITGSTTGVQIVSSPIGQQEKGDDVYYTLTFTYTATKNGTTKTDSISTTAFVAEVFTNVHLAGVKTGGVRFGAYSTSTAGSPKFECDYPIYAYGGFGQLGQYSTDEIATGMLWIDGSMIYRKVIQFSSVTNGSKNEIAIGASGTISEIIRVYGICSNASGYRWVMPHYDSNSVYSITMEVYGIGSTPTVRIFPGKSRGVTSAWVAVEYTLESLDTNTLAEIDDLTLAALDVRTLK